MNSRPAIPAEIKREVRQRCGFGCVICGLPLYEYEHMKEWASVKRHLASEMTLLCNKHHTEKTKGLLTKEMVEEANKSPYNLRNGKTKPYQFHFQGNSAEFLIGDNTFISKPDKYGPGMGIMPILLDRFPVIGFRIRDELLELDMQIFDRNNRNILRIVKNEMTYNSDLWDVEFVGRRFKIREKLGKIILDIEFAPPEKVILHQAQFFFNGIHVEVDSKRIEVMNNNIKFSNIKVVNVPYGITVGSTAKLSRARQGIDIVFSVEGFKRLPVPFLID